MSAKQQVGSIFRLRKGSIIILSQIFGLIHWAQAEIRTIQSNTAFDPNYLEHFLEPDSEEFRNISVCPKLWHLKDTLSVLKMWGYPGEEHTITTEDGYIMSIFRITPKRANAKPVLFLHGFLNCPETFLLLVYIFIHADWSR
uniref:Partial AB-hydrolase lipase domain-containing protein n=1 Tax=Cacopsylla melanoneura TaxID=428564 RepID=A0A8D8QKG6_9HEMI